jgi:thiol-disulfide isomerase/thioredoxin
MDSVGLLAVAAVLVIGIAVGLWRRRTDGRLRPIRVESARVESARVESARVESARVESARVESARVESDSVAMAGSAAGQLLDPLVLAALGVAPAEATLLQFSSAFCAPCRALRRVSSEVAAMLPGVQHIEVDAESHLDEVRALDIWRTPTLLVLDAHGRVTKRATGVPSKPQLIAALGDVLPATHRRSIHGT